MKKVLLIFIFELFFFSQVFSQSRELTFLQNIPLKEHFNPNDFDGGIQSWSFDQDSSGILYTANNKGLLEFDGRTWKKYDVPFSTRLRAVKVDHQNRIFVGGQGQIGYFTKKSYNLVFTSLMDYLPSNKPAIAETWKILEFQNKIYFNTESELFVFENDSLKAMTLPGYMRYSFKTANKLFAQFYNKGLYEIVNNEFIPIQNTTINQDIIAILPNERGFYCLTREGEIHVLNELGLTPVPISIELGTANDALKLKSGEYAIGTQSNGIYIFNSNFTLKRHLTKGQGLSDRTVKALYEDQFQNLWVALNNGIDYLKLSLPFSLLNEELGVEGTGYNAIKNQDIIYLGTNNGVFVQTTEKEEDSHNNPFHLLNGSEGQVYNFSKINNDLILNHNRGAFQLGKNGLTQIHDIGSWKFVATNDPTIALGSSYRGVSFFAKKNKNWIKTKTISNLDESLASIIIENDSTIWSSHYSKGAYKINFESNFQHQKKVTKYGKEDGFPSNIKINVYSLNNKLIFTSEKGIYDFNAETERFTANNYFNDLLGLEHVNQFVSNGSNAIYYIQNHKFGSLVQKSFGTHQKKTDIFKHVNQFINDDIANISILDDQNLLIGAKEGFINYNPAKKIVINEDFRVLLRSVEIESLNDSIKTHSPSLRDKIEISQSQSIKFKYASSYFDGFEELSYSFRLLPLSNQWSSWSNLGEKEFTHLPYGDYTMEIKALNIYGVESDITTFSFQVITPWFLTKWAKFGYLLLVLITLTLLPFLQRIRFKKEKSIIYENKAEALKIKDEEINKLENDNLKTELDLKNDQLTSITMQLVKNNDFILNIQNEIETSLKQKNPTKGMNKIIKNINKELSKDDSWDKFAYHFDQVHGNYLKKLADNNIKLSPREIKLAAFLRMNMSSKEISAMLNITTRGVELARYRLRKKLKLERDQNLVEYLIALDND